MPIYTVEGPDGKRYKIEGPAGATAEQLALAFQVLQASSGSTAAAPAPAAPAPRPENAGTLANLGMGALKGASDIGITAMRPFDWLKDQITGDADPTLSSTVTGKKPLTSHEKRVADQKYLTDYYADPESLSFKGGEIGAQIAGTAGAGGVLANGVRAAQRVAMAGLPTASKLASAIESGGFTLGGAPATTGAQMLANGATRVAGGAIAGGASAGMINPADTAMGAALGGAMPIAAKVAGEVGKGAKAAFLDPLFNQQKILDATLKRAVGEANAGQVAGQLSTAAQTPGVKFSAGESSLNPALTAMEDALRSQNPGGALGAQAQVNRSALATPLRNIAQDDTARAAAMTARDAAADTLYGKAFSADAMRRDMAKTQALPNGIGGKQPTADLATPELRQLMQRPDFKRAAEAAKVLAANKGVQIGDPLQSLQGLHYIKLALDDMANPGALTPVAKNAGAAINDMRSRLTSELEKIAPLYGNARQAYSQMSQPINQMDMGKFLSEKLIPPTSGDNPVSLTAASLARALQNPDQAAKLATGFPGASMGSVLTPAQLGTVRGVNADASRMAEAIKLGMGNGSPTARRLATGEYIGQNLAEQAPILSRIMQSVGNVPYVGAIPRGIGKAGSMIGNKINADMATQLEEMLANNPQAVADALMRVSAQGGRSLIGPQTQALLRTAPIAIQASP